MKSASLFVLVAGCLGLPMTDWAAFAILLIAAAAVMIGEIVPTRRAWRKAVIVALVVVAAKFALPLHDIEEGHAVFSPVRGSALQAALPVEVFESMRGAFLGAEPPFQVPARSEAWALSADAVWRRSDLSRWRGQIDFGSRWDLRIGTLNDSAYNIYSNRLGSTGAYLPLVLRFDLPTSAEGGKLCWRGAIYWPGIDGTYRRILQETLACRPLPDKFAGQRLSIYGEDFDPALPLSMRLMGTGVKDVTPVVKDVLGVLGAAAVLALLVRLPAMAIVAVGLSALNVAAALASRVIKTGLPSGYSPLMYMDRGNDGLTHYSFGREILGRAMSADWEAALRGGVDVFYFMPGMRYVWSGLMPFFGDSFIGYLLIVSLMPFLVVRLLRHFVGSQWIGLLFLCFMFIPVFESLGFLQYYFAKLAVRGFGGGVAWVALMGATVMLLPVFADPPSRSGAALFGAGLLCALAVSCRPNIAPGIAVFSGACVLTLLDKARHREYRITMKAAALALGMSVAFLITLHNGFYGGRLVWLTRAAEIPANLSVSPTRYLEAARAVLAGAPDARTLWSEILAHIGLWIGATEVWFQIVYASLWVVLFRKGAPLGVRVLSGSLIVNHAVFLFYAGVPRYTYGLWQLSFLVFLFALREVYWPLATARYAWLSRLSAPPLWAQRLAPISHFDTLRR